MARLYTRAAVCRRGHWISFDISTDASSFCQRCGAAVLTGCESCNGGIRGVEIDPEILVFGAEPGPPPRFCEDCGTPFPWLDREGRIYELQNLLDRENLDAAAALTVREQLDALLDPDLTEEEQRRRWERVRSLAPGLWESGRRILDTVVATGIKHEMGL